mgnify:CR=1 FL=1
MEPATDVYFIDKGTGHIELLWSLPEYRHMNDVLAHLDKPWDWGWLGGNPGITMKDVLMHQDKPWNWNWKRWDYHF